MELVGRQVQVQRHTCYFVMTAVLSTRVQSLRLIALAKCAVLKCCALKQQGFHYIAAYTKDTVTRLVEVCTSAMAHFMTQGRVVKTKGQIMWRYHSSLPLRMMGYWYKFGQAEAFFLAVDKIKFCLTFAIHQKTIERYRQPIWLDCCCNSCHKQSKKLAQYFDFETFVNLCVRIGIRNLLFFLN